METEQSPIYGATPLTNFTQGMNESVIASALIEEAKIFLSSNNDNKHLIQPKGIEVLLRQEGSRAINLNRKNEKSEIYMHDVVYNGYHFIAFTKKPYDFKQLYLDNSYTLTNLENYN